MPFQLTSNRSETGQILVIFALVLTALLGLTALAVDSAMVFTDRRGAQAGADSAAMAGAGAAAQYFENPAHPVRWDNFTCSNSAVLGAISEAKQKSIAAASRNAVTFDTDVSDQHGVTVDCVIENHGSWEDRYLDVKTFITAETDTSFAHLFYDGDLTNTVEAVVRVRPRVSLAYGYAIMSLSEDCGQNSGGVFYDGDSSLEINGGGVYSNSCMVVNGGPTIDVNGPIRFRTGTIPAGDVAKFTNQKPSPTTAQVPADLYPPPDCTSVPLHPDSKNDISASGTYNPGRYDKIKLSGKEKVTLKPGLYCITGSQGIQTGSEAELSNDPAQGGVTIFVQSGDVKITGGKVKLYSPTSVTSPSQGIAGMLFYLREGNTNPVNIEGNSSTAYQGTIYAPSGTVEIGGSSKTNPTFSTQLIGQLVKLHGNATIDINFNPSGNSQYDPRLDLYK